MPGDGNVTAIVSEGRIRLSRTPGFALTQFVVGPYAFRRLPTPHGSPSEYCVTFKDELATEDAQHSNPEGELSHLVALLSLSGHTRAELVAFSVNNLTGLHAADRSNHKYPELFSPLVELPIDALLNAMATLPPIVVERVCRACQSFSAAMQHMGQERSLSLLLLVVAIECLSTDPHALAGLQCTGNTDRFVQFMMRYAQPLITAPSAGSNSNVTPESLLRATYRDHRSAFVHAGKPVSRAIELADASGLSHCLHGEFKKDSFSPGLKWLGFYVRKAIMGFVTNYPIRVAGDPLILARRAQADAGIRLIASRAIAAGAVITTNDIRMT